MMIDQEHLVAQARKHGIRLAVLFGSAARGAMHARSDVDIGVVLDQAPNQDRLLELYADAGAIAPSHEVDLAILNHADPLFLFQAVRDAKLLLGDPVLLAELQARAFRQYQDHRRYLDLEREYARELTQGASS